MDFKSKIRNVTGLGRDGAQEVLETSGGLLYASDGSVAIKWKDGSDNEPICLPNLSTRQGASQSPLAIDGNGKIVRLSPTSDNVGKKCMLLWDGNTTQLVPFTSPNGRFESEDIGDATSCGQRWVAVFEGCDSSGALTLRKISLSDLFSDCSTGSQANALDVLVGCLNGTKQNLSPIAGFTIGAVTGANGQSQWGLVAIPPQSAAVGKKTIFRYTGSIQTLVVPTGATIMYVKAWGASGQSNGPALGGGGGYTYGSIAVTPGQSYGVLVGQIGQPVVRAPGNCTTTTGPKVYGFGGVGSATTCSYITAAGGGLSGLFTSTIEPVATDLAKGLLIAGGGGGGIVNGSSYHIGGGGNATTPVKTTMQGVTGGSGVVGRASGGGGHYGGAYGTISAPNNGGSGFTAGSVTGAIIAPATSNIAANNFDVDYQDQGGNGLVVVSFGA